MIKPTTYDLLTFLRANPHQEQSAVWTSDYKGWLILTTQNIVLYCDGDKWWWYYRDGFNPPTQDVVNPTQFTSLDTKDVHAEIDRVLNIARQTHTPSSTMQETVSTEQTFVSTDRYRELEAELVKMTAERDDLSVRVKQKTDVIKAQAAQIQQHSDGWEQTEAQLEAMTASRDATQERVEALQQLLPLFCLGVNAPTDQAREKIEGLYGRVKELGSLANDLSDQLKAVREERDKYKASYDYAQNGLHEVWNATGWLEHENEPCGIEYLKRLKSKAGLLSVVCRRLCGDENASIETVHKALDLFDDQRNALDYIGEKVGCYPDPFNPNLLREIQANVAQAVKSLGEKTVEVAKLQEGVTNYKAHVEGLTKRLEQMTFERDAERVGNKWSSETVEDLKRTTVKLPNEHTLRRLFNRHNAPDKYDDDTPIPTIERFLLIIENLCRNADCAERRFEELNAISTRVNTESEDAHATLDEMGVPRWTTTNNYNERYLSLSARIRSVFQTHTKV